MRISLNSCSLKRTAGPWRSLIVVTFRLRSILAATSHSAIRAAPEQRISLYALSRRAYWNRVPLGFFGDAGALFGCAELCQRFVELIGKLDELADRCDRAAGAL